MSALSKSIRNWRSGAIGAAGAVFVGILFLLLPPGPQLNGLARLSYDLPFALRPEVSLTNSEVWVIYMDGESHESLRQHPDKTWSRSLHTKLLQRLTAGGAKAVIFDIEFRFASDSRQEDLAFAKAIKENGRVFLAANIESTTAAGKATQTTPFLPVEPIGSAAPYGFVNLDQDNDGALRRHSSNPDAFAWKAAEFLGAKAGDPTEDRWINYYAPAGGVPDLKYYAALNLVPSGFFTNKIFLVGKGYVMTSKGRNIDVYRTALTRWTGQEVPGVEIQATILLNLLRKDWIARVAPSTELLLVLGIGCLFGFSLPLSRPRLGGALALSGCLVIGLIALIVWWQARLWFSWLIPCAVQIPCALGWAVFAHTIRIYREKEQVEAELEAARMAGQFPSSRRKVALEHPVAAAELQATVINARVPEVPHIPNYTPLRRVGRGAYGEVWLARDLILTLVAVKIIYRDRLPGDAPYEREFRGLQKFMPISRSHPGFVHILHVGRNEELGYFYYVMEIGDDEISGQNINPETYSARNLSNEIKRKKRLSTAESVAISLQLTAALEHLHQHQLIHRDIKPSNIIYVNNIPKIADIGLVTEPGREVSNYGTPGYIAREGPGTPAADVYSLGKILYQLVTGGDLAQFPEIPMSLVKQEPDLQFLQLNKIVLKACEEDPAQRFKSAAEMHASLLQINFNAKTLHEG